MYQIVVFEEDNRTGPVAKEWFSGGLAWWPPYTDKTQIIKCKKQSFPSTNKRLEAVSGTPSL